MAEKIPQIGKFDNQFMREIKLGKGYRSYKKELALPSLGFKDFIFETGNCDTVVYGFFIKPFSEPLDLELYGNPDVNSDGNDVFVINLASGYDVETPPLNRIVENMTVNSTGLLIDEDSLAGAVSGSSSNRIGLQISEGYERIVAPNTKFLVRIKNSGNSLTDFYLRFFWSENRIV